MTRDAHRPVLFFDIDDTLIDHRQAEEWGAGQLFERHSANFRAESVQAFVPDWQNASKKHLEEFLKGDISFAEQRIRRCREVAARPLTASEAALIFRDYLEAYEAGWTVFEEVPSALESLKSRGVRLGVISNGNVEQRTGKLERMNLLRYFEPVLISESLGVPKFQAGPGHISDRSRPYGVQRGRMCSCRRLPDRRCPGRIGGRNGGRVA